MSSLTNHKLNALTLKGMIESNRVEVCHSIEQGKGDYILNPFYYFDSSIAVNNSQKFKTEDREEKGKTIRVIYALNKDGVPFYNTYNILRPLADDKYKSGRVCIDCLNPVPPKKKNEYSNRLCCQECNKGNKRETIKKNRIIKINNLG